MQRYQVEEIVYQDKNGGIFHAKDLQTGIDVSLHRFFPNGKNNEGLKPDEAKAFLEAYGFMASISHPAIRKIHDAGIDPLDSTPYVVSEWIEGTSLHTLLANGSLEPQFVADLLRFFLDTSIHVSELVGHEGIWLDIDPASIIVSENDSERPVTFRLSPMKWLASSRPSKKSIILSEFLKNLMLWGNKRIDQQEGEGLGAWLCWLKLNPDTDLSQALQSLVVMTRSAKAQFPATLPVPATQSQLPQKAKSDSKSLRNVLLFVAAPMILACLALLILRDQKMDARQSSTNSASNPPLQGSANKTQSLSQNEVLAQRSLEFREQLEKSQSEKEAQVAKIKTEAQAQGGVYTPDDGAYASTLKSGAQFKLRGKLVSLGKSKSSGKSLYFYFSDPFKQGQIRGVVHQGDFQDTYAEETFQHLIGKTIMIDGVIAKEPSNNPVLVKAVRLSQITEE